MKAPAFRYHAPRSLGEALELAATLPGARLLAGGQSLLPMLNFRLLAPEHLIDLGRVPGLAGIEERGGEVRIGAMTRQREIEFSPVVAQQLPLLAEAIRWVGHRQTRNRGTLGGSLCHLDPAAEQPTVAMAMDARLEIARATGTRTVPMRAFAQDLMTPALEDGEILTAVHFTPWPREHGWGFQEYARRHGDYAIVAVAALLLREPAADAGRGRIVRASVTVGGVASTPQRVAEAEACLIGSTGDSTALEAAAEACARVPAMGDAQVPVWYRNRIARTLAARALAQAAEPPGALA
jgi:carbon-monoxide dehydrogenase medium subunit